MAALTGWPWVAETCAIASRHKNIWIDFACRRLKHMLAPGAGYEALIYYGARNLQDKVIFGSGWRTQAVPLHQLVAETDELPLKDSVRAKWMGGNAARVLGGGVGRCAASLLAALENIRLAAAQEFDVTSKVIRHLATPRGCARAFAPEERTNSRISV